MAFCIPKKNIKAVLDSIKSLSDDGGQIVKLIEMEPADRAKFFAKNLSEEQATKLSESFDKALSSRRKQALGEWMKKNFDAKYRADMEQKALDNRQRAIVRNYIRDRVKTDAPSLKKIDEIVAMPKEERLTFLKTLISDKEANLINNQIEKKAKAVFNVDIFNKNFASTKELEKFINEKADAFSQKKLGIALTNEEVVRFNELGKNLYESVQKLGDEGVDIMKNWDNTIAFGKSHQALEEYMQSLMPTNVFKDFVQRIRRTQMLFSLKSPVLNIESNTIGGVTEAVIRRFASWKFRSDVKSGVGKEYMKRAHKFYRETGLDITRIIQIEDPIAGAGRVLGESSAPGKFLRSYSDFVFNKLLTSTDVAFSSFAFTDSASMLASKMANGSGMNATDIFLDAGKLSPKTEIGKAVREMAVMDARKATYTNESWTSKFMLGLRETLNLVPGLGDIIMPFVKTVANVAELGADYAGVGFAKGAWKGSRLFVGKLKGKEIDREAMRDIMSDVVRSGLGLSTAYAITVNMDSDDFMGAYDPRRVGIDQLSNASYNAIRVQTPFGEKWISTDYFGPLAPSIVGMMYAKKYGGDTKNKLWNYSLGVGSRYIESLPTNVKDIEAMFPKIDPNNPGKTLEGIIKYGTGSSTDIVASMMIPGLMYDLAKASDDYQRFTGEKKYQFAGVNLDKFVQKIPFLRESLRVKTDSLGRVMHEESAVESLMFGARVRTARMDSVVKEIYRLRDSGYQPSVKDLRFSYSSKVDELKEKTGDKFYDIAIQYGQDLAREYEKEMKRKGIKRVGEKTYPAYDKLSDELKKKMLDEVAQDLYEKTLKKNGIKYR